MLEVDAVRAVASSLGRCSSAAGSGGLDLGLRGLAWRGCCCGCRSRCGGVAAPLLVWGAWRLAQHPYAWCMGGWCIAEALLCGVGFWMLGQRPQDKQMQFCVRRGRRCHGWTPAHSGRWGSVIGNSAALLGLLLPLLRSRGGSNSERKLSTETESQCQRRRRLRASFSFLFASL
jgi:hypothetical protein